MSWISDTFGSSLGKKVLVSLTSLFLIIFLIVHMMGNMQLFANDGGEAFNVYTYFMTHNAFIKTNSYLLYASILLHAIWGIALARKNSAARGQGYVKFNNQSSWASRNMALLGSLIFIFVVIHMKSFWYEMKFGEMAMTTIDGVEYKDLYTLVVASFQQWWYVAIYLVSLAVLGIHLNHGFQSAFQTLGINHVKYTPIIKKVGMFYSILIPVGFASQPIYVLFFLQ